MPHTNWNTLSASGSDARVLRGAARRPRRERGALGRDAEPAEPLVRRERHQRHVHEPERVPSEVRASRPAPPPVP
jgi:hypothetical protein